MVQPKWQLWKVTRIIKETPDVNTYRLEPVEGPGLRFRPGQFVNVYLFDEQSKLKIARPFSIASSPLDTAGIELTIKLHGGRFTGQLAQVKEGELVGLTGPFGSFTYSDELKDIVILTGGVGITPFRSFWRYINDKGLDTKVTIIYSCRTPVDIVYRKELEQLSSANPNIRVVFTCTREVPPDWTGLRGRINIEMIRQVCGDLAGRDYYICGPAAMVVEIEAALAAAGCEPGKVHVEKWANP